jgi:gliding motility-associated-like protein
VVVTTTTLLPSATTTLQPTVCRGDSILLNGTWYSQVNPSGADTLVAANGCDSIVQVSLQFYPAPSTETIVEELCAGEQLTVNGIVYNQANPAGVQTITSQATGCDSLIIEISLTFLEPRAEITVLPPDCAGQLGSLIIETVEDGSSPYAYSLDGQSFIPFNDLPQIIPSLPPNDYTVFVEDALGCRWSASVVLPEGPEPSLDLGEQIVLQLGDSVQLDPIIGFTYDTLLWSPQEILSCTGCLNPVVAPQNSVTVFLTATDGSGCQASDEVRIIVQKNRRVYFPNVFSPNEDGFNDTFYPSVDLEQVVRINTFQIYDRWGEQVFEAEGFQPNAPTEGWDGRFRGQELQPGVYVYYAEIEFIDGEVIHYEGDVTLIR